MVDAEQRQVVRVGQRLRRVDADEQRAGEAGTGGDGDGRQVAQPAPASASAVSITCRMTSRWWREATSGTTPPYGGVQVELRGDDVRAEVAAVLDDGGRGLVAGRLDAEDERARGFDVGRWIRMFGPGHVCIEPRRSGAGELASELRNCAYLLVRRARDEQLCRAASH